MRAVHASKPWWDPCPGNHAGDAAATWLACDGEHGRLLFSGYIGEFEVIDDHRSGKVVIELVGRINKCGVISPRFDLAIGQIEKWTNNLLPSRQFGYIVMTTSLGIMDHEEVRRKTLISPHLCTGMMSAGRARMVPHAMHDDVLHARCWISDRAPRA